MPEICIAISTMNERINNIIIPPFKEKISYIIIHQTNDDNHLLSQDLLSRSDDITYIKTNEFGLSKSRNLAILNCNKKYLFIMDDDVVFDQNKMFILVKNMEKNKSDVGTFYHDYTNGNSTLKKEKNIKLNFINIAKVSSIDICINIKKIKEKNIYFNENFGLGTNLPSGEEMIFLADCLKNRLNLMRYPLIIATHPPITSGLDFYSSINKIKAKKLMIENIYGNYSLIFKVLFTIKKFKKAKQAGYGMIFLKNMLLK
jgi:glycosyltransferase involved in cell wall biosynthesis